jgi:hypothetical protein
MSSWKRVLISEIPVVAVLAIIEICSVSSRDRTERLKGRFGSEYERTVGEVGEQRAAEDELAAREQQREKLDIVPLSPEGRALARRFLADGADRFRRQYFERGRCRRRIVIQARSRLPGSTTSINGRRTSRPTTRRSSRTTEHAHHLLAQKRGDGGTDQREAIVHYRASCSNWMKSTTPRRRRGHENPR